MACLCRYCILLTLLLSGCAGSDGSPAPATPRSEAAFLRAQLDDLQALQSPADVSAADWAALKSALAIAIGQRLAGLDADRHSGMSDAKYALAAPVTAGAQARLTFDLDSDTFLWRLYNPGDYDQNGEVNISDLTPLAAHFGEAVSTAPGGENSIQSVIDGDGNGLITIADITPLGANLGARITQFNLYQAGDINAYPLTPGDASLIPELDRVFLSEFGGERNLERIYYSYPSVPLLDGSYYWIRPADGTAGPEGTPSTIVSLSGVNFMTASLNATPHTGSAPLNVLLDASQSQGVFRFAFDPEGDGTYIPTGSIPSLAHIYSDAGVHSPRVQVENGGGLLLSGSVAINIDSPARWYRYTAPGAELIEEPRAVALYDQDGLPQIFVQTARPSIGVTDLGFFRGLGPTGNAWSQYRQLIGSGEEYTRLCSASIAGHPALVFGSDTALHYKRATGLDLVDWEQDVLLDNNGAPYEWMSLKYVASRASVAYHDPAADDLRFIRATGSLGDAWNAPQTPVVGATQGQGASLAQIAGLPAILYYDEGGFGALEYVAAQNASGTLWNAPVQISLGDFTMFDSLLELADGSPGAVVHDYGDGHIRFVRAADASGNNWPSVVQLATTDGDPRTVTRAMLLEDRAQAFWIDAATGELRYRAALGSSGLFWDAVEVVASGADPEVVPAPAVVGGFPAVAYVDINGQHRFAIRY